MKITIFFYGDRNLPVTNQMTVFFYKYDLSRIKLKDECIQYCIQNGE